MNAPQSPAGAVARRSLSIGDVEMLEIGDGPELVLLLHAAAQNPRAMAGLAKRLATPGRRILVPREALRRRVLWYRVPTRRI